MLHMSVVVMDHSHPLLTYGFDWVFVVECAILSVPVGSEWDEEVSY